MKSIDVTITSEDIERGYTVIQIKIPVGNGILVGDRLRVPFPEKLNRAERSWS